MKPREGIVAQQMGEDYILVPLGEAAQDIHGLARLNESGYFIWKALCEGLDVEQIAQRLTGEYAGVDLPRAREEVGKLVARLQEAKLVV